MADIIDKGSALKVTRDSDNVNYYDKLDSSGNPILFARVQDNEFILTFNGDAVERFHYEDNSEGLEVVTNPKSESFPDLLDKIVAILGNVVSPGADIGLTFEAGAESEGQSLNSTTGFLEKIKLTFTPAAGDYLIQWYYEFSRSSNNNSVEVIVDLDDSTELSLVTQFISTGDDFVSQSGFIKVQLLGGTHDIDIDFRKISGAGDAIIRKARLLVFRI